MCELDVDGQDGGERLGGGGRTPRPVSNEHGDPKDLGAVEDHLLADRLQSRRPCLSRGGVLLCRVLFIYSLWMWMPRRQGTRCGVSGVVYVVSCTLLCGVVVYVDVVSE